MRDFTDELVKKEDRSFLLGGEMFTWKYPTWEEFSVSQDEVADMQTQTNGEGTTTFKEIYKDYIDRCEPFLETDNDALKRWRALSKRKVDPVPAYLYVEVFKYLVGVTSNRPTELPSSFLNGQGQTEPTSTEGSS